MCHLVKFCFWFQHLTDHTLFPMTHYLFSLSDESQIEISLYALPVFSLFCGIGFENSVKYIAAVSQLKQ